MSLFAQPASDQSQDETKTLSVHYVVRDQYNRDINDHKTGELLINETKNLIVKGHKDDKGNFVVSTYQNGNTFSPISELNDSTNPLAYKIPDNLVGYPEYKYAGYRLTSVEKNTDLNQSKNIIPSVADMLKDGNLNLDYTLIYKTPNLYEGKSIVNSNHFKGNTVKNLTDTDGIESGIRITAHDYFNNTDESTEYSKKTESGNFLDTPRSIVNSNMPVYYLEGVITNTTNQDKVITDTVSWNDIFNVVDNKHGILDLNHPLVQMRVSTEYLNGFGNLMLYGENGSVDKLHEAHMGNFRVYDQGFHYDGNTDDYFNGHEIKYTNVHIKSGETLHFRIPLYNAVTGFLSNDISQLPNNVNWDNRWIRTTNVVNDDTANASHLSVALEAPMNDLQNEDHILASINQHDGTNWGAQAAPDYVQDVLKNLTPEEVKQIVYTNPFGEYDEDNTQNTIPYTDGGIVIKLDKPFTRSDGTTTTLQKELNKVGYVTDMTKCGQKDNTQTYLYFSDKPDTAYRGSLTSTSYPQAAGNKDILDSNLPTVTPGGEATSNTGLGIGVHPIIITHDVTLNVGQDWDGTKNLIAVKRLNSSAAYDDTNKLYFFPKDELEKDKNWDAKKLGPKPVPAQKYTDDLNIFSENDPLSKLNDITENDGFKTDSSNLPMKDGKVTTPGVYTVTYSMPVSVPIMNPDGTVKTGQYYTKMVQCQAKVNVLGEGNYPFTEHVDFVDDSGNPLSINGKTYQEVTQTVHIKTSKNTDGTITSVRQPNIENFDEFVAPQISGYTYRGYKIGNGLLQSGNIPQTKLADVTYTAVYTPDQQTLNVKFVDDDSKGSQVGKLIPYPGVTGQTVDLNLSLPEHYDLANKENPLPTKYTFKAANNDIVIHLVHKKVTTDVTQNVQRTISVNIEGKGTTNQTQNLAVTGTKTVDEVTNATTYKWSGNPSFPAVELPSDAGYIMSVTGGKVIKKDGKNYVAAQAGLTEDKNNPQPVSNIEVTVTYQRADQSFKINFVNKDKETVATQTVSGKIGDTVRLTVNGTGNNKLQVPKGWKLVDENSLVTATFGATPLKDQTVVIEHKIDTVDGRDHKDDTDLYRKVTRSWTSSTVPGAEPSQSGQETLEFYRIKSTDEVTNEVTYSTWKSNMVNNVTEFSRVDTKVPDGYSVSMTNAQPEIVDGKVYIPAQSALKDGIPVKDYTVVLTYTKNSEDSSEPIVMPDGQVTVIYQDKAGNKVGNATMSVAQDAQINPSALIMNNLPAGWLIDPTYVMPDAAQAGQTIIVNVVEKSDESENTVVPDQDDYNYNNKPSSESEDEITHGVKAGTVTHVNNNSSRANHDTRTLPKTGESSSTGAMLIGLALASAAGFLGLAADKKRKN